MWLFVCVVVVVMCRGYVVCTVMCAHGHAFSILTHTPSPTPNNPDHNTQNITQASNMITLYFFGRSMGAVLGGRGV